jgi:hypothetical protein
VKGRGLTGTDTRAAVVDVTAVALCSAVPLPGIAGSRNSGRPITAGAFATDHCRRFH